LASNTIVNRYGSIAAEIYDIDKPVGAMPDTAFYLDALTGVSGPVLEPACGSGRTLLPLLQAGHAMAGFDPSAEMLERCRARCAEAGFTPDLSRQSFADFTYSEPFGAIVIPAGTFTLIADFAAAMDALGRFRDHLTPGGRLVLDIQPISSLARTAEDQRSWTAENSDLLTLEGKRIATDWLGQTARTVYRYERWRDNRLIESQLEPMAQRFWGVEEFRLALLSVGFGDIVITGNYRPGPLSERARSLTFDTLRL
jgi:SAM-dependent methyltransferase